MDVSPQTLREVEFRQALRGYNSDDVDEFLDRVAAGLEILQDRLRQATERAVKAEEKAAAPAEAEESMRQTLALAQRTAELAAEEAREQANRVLAGAETRARELLSAAEADSRRAAADAQRSLRREIAELERARTALQADIAAFERHLAAERTRVAEALGSVARRLEDHVLQPVPPPAPRPVHIPPEPATPEPRTFVVEDSHNRAENEPFGDEDDGDDDGDDVDEDREGVEFDDGDDGDEDDPFLAELRLAATDTEPLGPRPGDRGDEAFFDQDNPAPERRGGPFLRRS